MGDFLGIKNKFNTQISFKISEYECPFSLNLIALVFKNEYFFVVCQKSKRERELNENINRQEYRRNIKAKRTFYIYINNNSEIPLYKYSHSSLCVCPDESL
jgi:hypothetical protein